MYSISICLKKIIDNYWKLCLKKIVLMCLKYWKFCWLKDTKQATYEMFLEEELAASVFAKIFHEKISVWIFRWNSSNLPEVKTRSVMKNHERFIGVSVLKYFSNLAGVVAFSFSQYCVLHFRQIWRTKVDL